MTTQLDPRAVERVSGPSWQALKPAVLEIGEVLLGVAPGAKSNLTTIYVKFERPGGSVYSVMWIKKSTQAVVGLALPEDTEHERLHDAPKGMTYPGLTRYFTVQEGDDVPGELADWAKVAYANAYLFSASNSAKSSGSSSGSGSSRSSGSSQARVPGVPPRSAPARRAGHAARPRRAQATEGAAVTHHVEPCGAAPVSKRRPAATYAQLVAVLDSVNNRLITKQGYSERDAPRDDEGMLTAALREPYSVNICLFRKVPDALSCYRWLGGEGARSSNLLGLVLGFSAGIAVGVGRYVAHWLSP